MDNIVGFRVPSAASSCSRMRQANWSRMWRATGKKNPSTQSESAVSRTVIQKVVELGRSHPHHQRAGGPAPERAGKHHRLQPALHPVRAAQSEERPDRRHLRRQPHPLGHLHRDRARPAVRIRQPGRGRHRERPPVLLAQTHAGRSDRAQEPDGKRLRLHHQRRHHDGCAGTGDACQPRRRDNSGTDRAGHPRSSPGRCAGSRFGGDPART